MDKIDNVEHLPKGANHREVWSAVITEGSEFPGNSKKSMTSIVMDGFATEDACEVAKNNIVKAIKKNKASISATQPEHNPTVGVCVPTPKR